MRVCRARCPHRAASYFYEGIVYETEKTDSLEDHRTDSAGRLGGRCGGLLGHVSGGLSGTSGAFGPAAPVGAGICPPGCGPRGGAPGVRPAHRLPGAVLPHRENAAGEAGRPLEAARLPHSRHRGPVPHGPARPGAPPPTACTIWGAGWPICCWPPWPCRFFSAPAPRCCGCLRGPWF